MGHKSDLIIFILTYLCMLFNSFGDNAIQNCTYKVFYNLYWSDDFAQFWI